MGQLQVLAAKLMLPVLSCREGKPSHPRGTHLTWCSNTYSPPLHLLPLPVMQTPPSFLEVREEKGAAAKEMMERAGCFRALSRVMEEKPAIQEAATELESSGTGLFFRCVCTWTAPCWELGWAAASPVCSQTFTPSPQIPDGEVEQREGNCLRLISSREKRKRAKVVI